MTTPPAGTQPGRVPLPDLLARARPAYGGDTWDDVITTMRDDPDEWETVQTLRAVLDTGRRFTNPVIIDPDDGQVRNGMHRIVAAILSNAADIDVTDTYPTGPARQRINVEYTLDLLPDRTGEDPMDVAVGTLRSFPLAGHWVETDHFSSVDGVLHGDWYCPHELADQLADALIARAAARSAELRIVSVRAAGPDDDDAN